MKKRLLALVLALVMVFSLLPSAAFAATTHSGSCGENLTWRLSNGTLTISGTGAMTNYKYSDYSSTIPWYKYKDNIETVTIGKGVTSIGNRAFYYCSKLTSITIPSSVKSIGDRAFYYCGSLTSIKIPSSVTSIGISTFYYCSSLKSISIPSSSSLKSIDESAFCYCGSLTSIKIPSSVTSIGSKAFLYCSSLKSINVDSGNTTYSSADGVLFNFNKDKLICCPGGKSGSYTVPSSVTSIDGGAFSGCSSLTSVSIPSSVTSIGSYPFRYCSSLKKIEVSSKNTAYSSEDGVLFNKNQTKLINYPGGKSGSYTVPSSVTSIGDFAFAGCSSLTSVSIPSSVTSIGGAAFSGCSSLTEIIVSSDSKDYSSSEGVLFNKDKTRLDCYPGGKIGTYTVPSTVTSIRNYALHHCSLSGIVIPVSVKTIGSFSFGSCSSLTDVYYTGSASEWSSITIGSSNDGLTNATIHYCEIDSTTAPTYTSKGYTKYKCSDCGKEYTETIPMLELDAPVIKAKRTANSVKLTWNAVEGATGYIIQRRAATGKNWSDLATTDGLTYTNGDIPAGYAYSYRVKAYAGDVSTNSSVSEHITTYVGQVTGLSVVQQKKGVKVSWSKLNNASGYKVYRKVSSGDWKLIKTITSGSTVTYTDTAATNTRRNYYKIVAYRTISKANFKALESESKNLIYIAAPSVSSATNSGSGKITVKWTENATATGYRVKVMGTKLCSFYTITSPSTLSKVVTGRAKDTYKIYVQAYLIVNDKKYYSEWSSYKTVEVTK